MSELELELRELRIDWPETPDIAAAVQGRLAAPPRRRSWLARPAWQLAVAGVALIVAVVMAIPPARAAVLDWLGFGSVRITREEPRPSRFGAGARARRSRSRSSGRAASRFPVLVPDELGEPDAVYLYEHPVDGPARRHGVPRASGPAGLQQHRRRAADHRVPRDRHAGDREVGRHGREGRAAHRGRRPGVLHLGRPARLRLPQPRHRNANFEDQRLAGNTLLVERADGVLLRIEGDISRERAVEIAESVR